MKTTPQVKPVGKDEGPLDSLGEAIGEVVTGSLPDGDLTGGAEKAEDKGRADNARKAMQDTPTRR